MNRLYIYVGVLFLLTCMATLVYKAASPMLGVLNCYSGGELIHTDKVNLKNISMGSTYLSYKKEFKKVEIINSDCIFIGEQK